MLVAANEPAEGDVQLLAELLAVPAGGRYGGLDLTPQRRKERTLEALLRQLAGLTRQQHVLMIFGDLHWADPSSCELLDLTVEQIGRLPVLLVATFRPEFQPPWIGQPHVTIVSLRRLAQRVTKRMKSKLFETKPQRWRNTLDRRRTRTRHDNVETFASAPSAAGASYTSRRRRHKGRAGISLENSQEHLGAEARGAVLSPPRHGLGMGDPAILPLRPLRLKIRPPVSSRRRSSWDEPPPDWCSARR